jgi:hypothetical protein
VAAVAEAMAAAVPLVQHRVPAPATPGKYW